MKWCVSCFKQYDEEYDICPFCGAEEVTEPKAPIHIKPGTELYHGRYVIGLAIGDGGFGVVYRAWDKNLSTIVAIKEFYMSSIMVRAEGEVAVSVYRNKADEYYYRKKRFLSEARAMAKFGGIASIPKVYDFFEDNGTAYIAMELFTGQSLKKYLKEQESGKVDPEFAVYVATEVAQSLKIMHNNHVVHRDVAPDNIFYTEKKNGEREIDVIDLGTAQLSDDTDKGLEIVIKNGFSPVEQYDPEQKHIGPWTDVYALGATLYNMLTGIKPTEATTRKTALEWGEKDPVQPPHELDPSIPENLSNAVMRAMSIDVPLRFKNMDEFVQAISGKKKVRDPKKEKRFRAWTQFAGIAAAVLVLVAVGGILTAIFANKGADRYLAPAEISVWVSVKDGSTEESAMRSVAADFMGKYPGVKIDIRAIPEDRYQTELEKAAKENRLPSLFESTGIPNELLIGAESVKAVLDSDQARSCLFLDQYYKYDVTGKRVPLAIKVPMAYLITNGAVKVEYADPYFKALEDFGGNTVISMDPDEKDLIRQNFGDETYADKELFMNNEANQSAVMLSSTMAINDVRETLTNYQKAYTYFDGSKIHCAFLYEWSIGRGSKEQNAAAERLLSWMLGNVYQNMLMISECNEGQIPINKESFNSKISIRHLSPIQEIYKKFVFEH